MKALAVRGDTAATNGTEAQATTLEVGQALAQLQGLAQSRGYLLFDDILAIWPQAEDQIEALEDGRQALPPRGSGEGDVHGCSREAAGATIAAPEGAGAEGGGSG